MKRRKKPDLMMLLVIVIGLGVFVTAYAFDMTGQFLPRVHQVEK